jgi:hypothetical protein
MPQIIHVAQEAAAGGALSLNAFYWAVLQCQPPLKHIACCLAGSVVAFFWQMQYT